MPRSAHRGFVNSRDLRGLRQLITQRSLVQIQPPQPKKNKGLAGAISLAPSSFSVFFPVGRLAQRSSSALSCSFRVRGDCSPRPALAMIIALGSSPDQSRQINHLLTGRSFGEGQVFETFAISLIGSLLSICIAIPLSL